jgi:hypothetical protein
VGGVTDDFGTSLNANGQVIAGTGLPDTSIVSGSGFNNGAPHLVTFERTRSTGALALYVDGNLVSTGTGGAESLTAPGQLVLGAVTAGGGYLSGDIAEVKIFNAALPNSDRSAEESELSCKYGLSGGSAPATPTGLSVAAGDRQTILSWVPTAGAENYNIYRSTDGLSYTLITNLANVGFRDASAVSGQTNYYEIASMDGCGASANSAPMSVLLPLPIMELSVNANALIINWPGWASNWMLYSATNLTPPVAWTSVTNAVSSSNGFFNVSMPFGPDARFFRLESP